MRLQEIDPASISPGDKMPLGQEIQDSGKKLAQYIQQHCSDIIKDMQVTGKTLYRGISGISPEVFVGQSRESRRPKDTSKADSAFFDEALSSHGFKALRRNSIFVTTDWGQAEGYGRLYAIFPMNGFEYTYTIQKDLIIGPYYFIDYPDNFIEETTEWLKRQDTKDNRILSDYFTIQGAIESIQIAQKKNLGAVSFNRTAELKSEIGDGLSNLARILPDDPYVQKFKNFNYQDPKSWSTDAAIKNLEPKNTDIQQAMKDRKEIFINGKYVAVNISDNNLRLSELRGKLGI
jgi:hypothetical protein